MGTWSVRLLVASTMAAALACGRDFDAPFAETSRTPTEPASSSANGALGGRDGGVLKPTSNDAAPDPGSPAPVAIGAFDAPGTQWELKGDATRDAGTVSLVPVDFSRGGAAWWAVPQAIGKLTASFGFKSNAGAGYPAADGIA